ncbi:MarR family winged helix-turn-helix transcriptional regulator [Exiguobacterium profundum]|uniref:MarR family transcriptional regulator n=1 Tax=Exiguobacterium profundum TaxID=307643 RepID=A0ABY8AYG7_9BACL|nr:MULTISPECIES: MarR family transcriptional regulator [Exiguobacterium]QPI67355.1 MarR family transcriptional regulator [Exiguobacterium sp. PBE]MCT4799725.1 MarR family transcriptional regulator [Exiguobacterium profundum]MCV9901217.1 MarR family transcriptional regulator [Exiguobacterium sp. N5]MDT0193486.1 MarR family transcriptional regulator [Exiguobacterium sp. BG5(2022)]MDX5981283.1 MarR family transcriptional regulator [Exiguobacterium profundum]
MNETRKQQVLTMYRQIDELDLLFTKYFTELNEFELSYQQEQMLLLFKRQETWTTTEIATKMSISKSAVSQVLKVLEQRDFVMREKNPENLRESFIRLGPNGLAYSKQIDAIEERLAEEMFSVLEDDEMKMINRSLALMIQKFK